MQAIPCIMSGRDVIGNAETGSGKTLAYVLPLLALLQTQPVAQPGMGPLAVILSPARELAEQIYNEIDKFLSPFSPYIKSYQQQQGQYCGWCL